MTAPARITPRRRGACPGLSAPMATGDGLLVRLLPTGTISLAAFSELCAAARTHGNSVIEITSRGSIQIRGLSAASAPLFAATVAALGIAADDGVPIHCNALAGLNTEEIFDSAMFAADLRHALAGWPLAAKLAAKVCVVIDGGGGLSLSGLAADIRLRAERINGDVVLRVSVGSNDASATDIGVIACGHGVDAVIRLLELMAHRGGDARARDILASEGALAFRDALLSYPALCQSSTSDVSGKRKDVDGREEPGHDGNPVGLHTLRDGSLARGVGFAFGHTNATTLERLIDAAAAAGANGLRAAPGRALLTIGLSSTTEPVFSAAAQQLGFIVRADDPRRRVVACAGAPICASAHIAARTIAPQVALQIDGTFTVHVSGCSKGCAHQALAALTVIGTPNGCALVANGTARDMPYTVIPADELLDEIARYGHGHEASDA
jgi:precorrin-3B synthase